MRHNNCSVASITAFDFAVVFLTIYQYLSHLSGWNSSLDIAEAYATIEDIRRVYKHKRENIVNNGFRVIYDQATRMAEKVGTLPSMSRVATRQQYRSNIASLSPVEYHNLRKTSLYHFLSTSVLTWLNNFLSCQ